MLDWLTKNTARIAVDHPDPTLRAITIDRPAKEAAERAAAAVAMLPRWNVMLHDPEPGASHVCTATRTTRLWGFVDDVVLEFRGITGPDGRQATVVTGSSRSRVGKGDFGQNARNLREVLRAIRTIPPARKTP
jgi:uncharacterized protein (DUF1499 family)